MSVEEYNYRIRNTAYHTQTYFTVVDSIVSGVSDTEPVIYYPGYNSGISTAQLIPISEWESLTSDAQTEGKDPYNIEGDISGFTNQATTWHTPLHVFATDGETYSLGVSVIQRIPNQYNIALCTFYTNSNIWHAYMIQSFNKTIIDPMTTIYDKQADYYYLSMSRNVTVSTRVYPYPDMGGVYFKRKEDDKYVKHQIWWFNHELYGYDFIATLYDNGLTPEENPDPQPTPIANDDPYSPGGESWTGGGDGKFDPTTDDVGIPGLPALSATSTGFITLFNPSVAQLRNLANYMWSGLFDIDTFRKIFADPMDCILGLSIVPVNVPSGGSASVMVGNIDTGISMTTASAQYVEVDCGSVTVEENYGAYLDYEPYTKAELYLPYIGIHAISIDDIMKKTVTIKYHIDILSGACVAYVKCGSSVLYSFIGQCASSIPITGNDWTNVINGVLSIAGSIGSMVATGGANAPTQVANIASTAVNSMKPSIEKSGSLSGTGGMLGIQTPYLILTRPRQAIPAGQNRFIGYPAFITEILGNVSGYTEVESIHLEGIQATGAELSEIETILKTGVIF